MNSHKYLHELVKEQERNQRISELMEAIDPDPWRYSEPPLWPLTLVAPDA